MEKKYYKPSELRKMGYPIGPLMKLAREINRRSNPEARRGYHYLLTREEAERCLTR